jgi:hypothetical protein
MPLTVYDYDFRVMSEPRYYSILKPLDFLIDMNDHFRFSVPDTDLYIYLTFSSFFWVVYPTNGEPKLLTFEEVLDLAPEDVVTKIIFNLDIFKCEKNFQNKAVL